MYLPDQKIAIEIVVNNQSDRDQIYEQEREQYNRQRLGWVYTINNSDAENFKLSSCVGIVMRATMGA